MDEDVAILVEHVSKKYCKSLKRSMLYGVKDIARNALGLSSHSEILRKGEFWAVDAISFELKKGETLGIIGPNGSGKTTLLKMLNGIFWPDKGKITIKGRVGALIEVGAGFHPLLTGRENIYINAAILGMTKDEVDAKFDDIVAFADIGDFLDTPVKFYSSGMYVRLGFAVAVHCEPDILLVDEVLAVGDQAFQSKCWGRIAQIQKKGVAIIVVSHGMDTIRHVCDTALLIYNGKLMQIGDSDKVVLNYLRYIQKEQLKKEIIEKQNQTNEIITQNKFKRAEMNRVYFLDSENNETNDFDVGDEIKIRIEYKTHEEIRNPVFAVHFYSGGMLFLSFISKEIFCGEQLKGEGQVELIVEQLYLPAGGYTISAIFSQDVEYNHIDWHSHRYFINVSKKEKELGLVALPNKWRILSKRNVDNSMGNEIMLEQFK